jgi:hypothetical protein
MPYWSLGRSIWVLFLINFWFWSTCWLKYAWKEVISENTEEFGPKRQIFLV